MADKRKTGKKVLDIFKGIIVRLLFLLHASSSLILLYNNNNLNVVHVSFIIPLLFLLVEGVITIFCYRGQEIKYVWPCGFFYIATVAPVVWVLELGVLKSKSEIEAKILNDPKHRGRIGHFRGIESELLTDLLNLDGRKFCEIGVIICLIAGRWLSPRSSLSRQTLSAMLLSYVANAADILDLFTSLQAPELINHKDVTYGILTIYTWSLLQFALVATVVYKKRRRKGGDKRINGAQNTSPNSKKKKKEAKTESDPAALQEKAIQEKLRKKRNRETEGFLNRNSYDTRSIGTASILTDNGVKKGRLQRVAPETPQLLIGLMMQDGPFLLLRLVLCVKYGVYDELHVFFLLKNSVVCLLLLYRLILVSRDYQRAGNADNANSCAMSEYSLGNSDDESLFDPYRVTSYI